MAKPPLRSTRLLIFFCLASAGTCPAELFAATSASGTVTSSQAAATTDPGTMIQLLMQILTFLVQIVTQYSGMLLGSTTPAAPNAPLAPTGTATPAPVLTPVAAATPPPAALPTPAPAATTATPAFPAGTTVASCNATPAPGFVMIHRLNNDEYDNTVRDLLYSTQQPALSFPATLVGKSGFQNDSAALDVTDELMVDFYQAAESLADEVIASKGRANGAYAKLVSCTLATTGTCAQTVIGNLAARAFRRPLVKSSTVDELAELMAVYNAESVPDTGLHDTIVALLMRPEFLFVYFDNPQAQTAGSLYTLNNYELASRLSYFLWQSMPDAELTTQAAAGALTNPATLAAEADRMLKDPRAMTIAKSLRQDFASIGTFEKQTLQGLDPATQASMVEETELLFEDIIRNDRSFLTTVTSTTSYLNQTLAQVYGIGGTFPSDGSYVVTPLPATQRRGLITQASVLMATAGATDNTHPVRRGVWVASQIACTPPGPKPNNVPPLPSGAAVANLSPKQILLQHASNASCAFCHDLFDQYGLSLESYDPFGKWRTFYDAGQTVAVDPTGTLPDGTTVNATSDMLNDLAGSTQVRSCLAQQLMSYATTRALTFANDRCTAFAIGAQTMGASGKFSDLVKQIVASPQFLQQTGEN